MPDKNKNENESESESESEYATVLIDPISEAHIRLALPDLLKKG